MAESRFLVQETLIVLCLCFLSSTPAATSVDSSALNRSCIADERAALLSVKASLLDPNNYLYRHGKVKIAAAGRESAAAQKQAMLSSSILGA